MPAPCLRAPAALAAALLLMGAVLQLGHGAAAAPTAGSAADGSGSVRAAAGAAEWHKPAFCGKLDCPEFTIKQKHPDFQTRTYKAASWVAVNASAVKYEQAVKEAVPLLFDYFHGANKETLRLRETVPLAVHFRLDLHPHTGERRNFTVMMPLPDRYQASAPALDHPPQPNSTSLWLYCSPEADVYVRMFEHRIHEWRAVREAGRLARALDHAGHGEDYEPGALIAASYDHPSKHHPRRLKYRHSEIWLLGGASEKDARAAVV